jgi:hypothetical protein
MLKELRSDNVFLFQGMDEKAAVVVEVQTAAIRLRARPHAPSRRPVLRPRVDHAAHPHRHP